MRFCDRSQAGVILGANLKRFASDQPVVVGLPRGGVAVAAEVALALNAPLDFICSRKVGAPSQPEFAIGAIAPGDVAIFNREAIRELGIGPTELSQGIEIARGELARQTRLYLQTAPHVPLAGETVLLIDDGLATGMTAMAAASAIRAQRPHRIILAAPVGARETVSSLGQSFDDVVCLHIPDYFEAVGSWYNDFGQLTDDEVTEILRAGRRRFWS